MKPINYYTTIPEEIKAEIDGLSMQGKIFIIRLISDSLHEQLEPNYSQIKPDTIFHLVTLNRNQSLGLIKALCDQCQETLISK